MFIHASAVVEPEARVGEGSRVWHHAHLRDGSIVGAECSIGKNVFIDQGAVIGDRVKIQNNVSVYRGVTIEDDVFVGPSAVFTNDRVPRASADGWGVTPTVVRAGASIGANATLVCGIEIGRAAMIAAGSVVTRDVRAHEVVGGNPARHFGWVCTCGAVLSRALAAADELQCERCGGAA